MSIKQLKVITTQDTKEDYTFGDGEEHPGLFEVKINIKPLNKRSGFQQNDYIYQDVLLHLTEKTLADAGCDVVPKEVMVEKPDETLEDLLIKLLEHVGVYQQQ